MKNASVSLILPIYNEGSTLEKSINSIINELQKLNRIFTIIFVEDKSTDNNKLVIEQFEKKYSFIECIYHKRNGGRGKSVKDGILAAKNDICGYMDVDCEIAPSYIPIFISEIEQGNDLVIANRFYDKKFKSAIRYAASKTYSFIVKHLLNIPFEDTEAGFKFFNRKKIVPILSKTKNNGWFWDTEICTYAYFEKLNTNQVPVLFRKRSEKKSTVMIFKDSLEYLIQIFKLSFKIKKYTK